MLDTSAIIAIAEQHGGASGLDQLLRGFAVLVPTPALYEVTFGPKERVSTKQKELMGRLSKAAAQSSVEQPMAYHRLQRAGQVHPGLLWVVNPTIHEWESARNRLVSRLKADGGDYTRGKLKHSLDSLIHSCARNHFCPICTENVSDFEKFNAVAAKLPHDGAIPIFKVADSFKALSEQVTYDRAGE